MQITTVPHLPGLTIVSGLADSPHIISISSLSLKMSLSRQTDISPCIRHPVFTPKLVTKQACASGMSIHMPRQSFTQLCKPGRRPPKFSPAFCCLTGPAQRLICSALSWAVLVGAGWLNPESRRASAQPVKPFNWVNGEKARRLFWPTRPLRRAKIKLWLCKTVNKRREVEVSGRRGGGGSEIKGPWLVIQRSLRNWATSCEPHSFIQPRRAKHRSREFLIGTACLCQSITKTSTTPGRE